MISRSAKKFENTKGFSIPGKTSGRNSRNANSLFEIAERLQHDAEMQHSQGNHERAEKSTLIAKEIQLIAEEKMLSTLRYTK